MTDKEWREACLLAYGPWCRNCGYENYRGYGLQVDHLIPRGQGGENVVANGLVLCGPFVADPSPFPRRVPGGCHLAVTDERLKRRIEWLDPEQLDYLRDQGWLRREPDGSLSGKGMNYFDG